MADTTTAQPASQPGLLARMLGVLTSPKATFAAVAARPRWLGVMAITLVISAACQYVILSSPAMQDAMYEQATRNPNMTEAQVAGAERGIERLPIFLPIGTVLLGAGFTAAVAGILGTLWS